MSQTDEKVWVTSVARRHTPLFLSIAVAGQSRDQIERHAGLPMGFPNQRRQGLAYQFLQNELGAGRSVVGEAVQAGGLAFFDEYSERCLATARELLATASTELGESPDAHAELSRYFEAAVAHGAQLLVVILVQFQLEDFLDRFVAERVGADAKADTLSALKVPTDRTNEVLNLEGLLRLGAEVQQTVDNYSRWIDADPSELITEVASYANIWDRIERFQEQFGWMGRMYYAGQPISGGDVVLRLQNQLTRDCVQRLEQLERDRAEQRLQRDAAIEALGGDTDAVLLAELVGRYLHLRSYRLDAFFIAHERRVPFLLTVAQTLGLTYEELLYLDWREILEGLGDDGPHEDFRTLSTSRQSGFAMLTTDGVTEWMPADPTLSVDDFSAANRSDVLNGVTACPGEYHGRVRVLLTDADMEEMEAGEVLVTTMTTPSLMLAVEKASAIVTDEGGMLCHAAIVSREFGIPCVIGTEHATRWLKTGDHVAVDATTGVVRLLATSGAELDAQS